MDTLQEAAGAVRGVHDAGGAQAERRHGRAAEEEQCGHGQQQRLCVCGLDVWPGPGVGEDGTADDGDAVVEHAL